MFSQKIKKPQIELLPFTPPKRHDGKSSYISFYILDPVSGKRRRKKYMLDRFKKGLERNLMASQMMTNLYTKLMMGWNHLRTFAISCSSSLSFVSSFSASLSLRKILVVYSL